MTLLPRKLIGMLLIFLWSSVVKTAEVTQIVLFLLYCIC